MSIVASRLLEENDRLRKLADDLLKQLAAVNRGIADEDRHIVRRWQSRIARNAALIDRARAELAE